MRNTILCASFFSIILLISCNTKIDNITNLDEGKSYVNSQIENYLNQYDNLCELKRNDQLKTKFSELHDNLLLLNQLGFQISNLSYLEQNKLVDYTTNEIKKHKQLEELAYSGNISCW